MTLVRVAAVTVIVAGLVVVTFLMGSEKPAENLDPALMPAHNQPERKELEIVAAEHPLEGRWRVNYEEPWFTGSLVYELRQQTDGLKGYLVEITGEGGMQSVSGDLLIFELSSWDDNSGAGLYYMEFEGVAYKVECDIELQAMDRLHVRYTYNGGSGEETWVRIRDGGDQDSTAASHVLEGRWGVTYDDSWFTGSLVYELRAQGDDLRGFLVEIGNDSGVQPVSDGSLIFELHSWNGTKGACTYHMDDEGVAYEAECDAELQSEGQLRVRYSYNGGAGE